MTVDDDGHKVTWVEVTNPEGVTFPAVLGKFSKAGVVSFFVLPDDAPPGEDAYERTEFSRPVPTSIFPPYVPADQRVYKVVRRD